MKNPTETTPVPPEPMVEARLIPLDEREIPKNNPSRRLGPKSLTARLNPPMTAAARRREANTGDLPAHLTLVAPQTDSDGGWLGVPQSLIDRLADSPAGPYLQTRPIAGGSP